VERRKDCGYLNRQRAPYAKAQGTAGRRLRVGIRGITQGYTHSKLPTSPRPLHNPELIPDHRREQDLARVRITHLPYQPSPKLPVAPEVRHDLDVDVVARVGQAGEQRASDEPEDQEAADGRVGEAGG
jgi:hypothetical protein